MYVALGSASNFWENARALGQAALDELEDAADGVLGFGAKQHWLDWIRNTGRPSLAQAVSQQSASGLKVLQAELQRARDALPTTNVSKVNPFLSLQAPASSSAPAPSNTSSPSPSVPPALPGPAASSGLGTYALLAGAGVAAVVVLAAMRKKRR